MDVMELRRGLMMAMATASDGWQQKTITAPTSTSNASEVKDWIMTIEPSAEVLVFVRDDLSSMTSRNGTMLSCFIGDRTSSGIGTYTRWQNNNYNAGFNWANLYDLAVDAGDSYTIFYK